MNESVRICLGCLLPTVFDVTLTCQAESCGVKWGIREVDQVEKSVRRQLDATSDKWNRETCGKVQVDYKLRVSGCPVRLIKECRVKEPSVAALLGDELYGKATCFMVWVPLPDCSFPALGKQPPYTKGDYMWIPTTEKRELDDLTKCRPRDAASHELKHWVKNRMKDIGTRILSPDGKDKKQYWPKLREALTDANIAALNKNISERQAE